MRHEDGFGNLQYTELLPLLVWTSKSQRLSPRRRTRIKYRLLRKTGHTGSVAWFQTLVVIRSIVHGNSAPQLSALGLEHHHPGFSKDSPVIPQRTRPSSPVEANLNVNIALIHLVQVLQNRIALAVVKANDTFRHSTVDVETLPAGDGVHADKRVAALDVLGAGIGVITVEVRVC